MRVIYLVRAVQLLVTLRALWMLYSVSSFCEGTQHTMATCKEMIARIPMATPEQIEEHPRIKQQRAASNRTPAKTFTSSPQPPAHSTPTIAESSTVSSSFEEVKKRVKREERRELPGNGMTEAQRKAAAAVVPTKKEEDKMEIKKEEEKKNEEETEVRIEEVKVEEMTPEPSHSKTDDKKEQPREQKEEQKPAHPEVKTEVKTVDVMREEETVETTPVPIEKSPKEKIEQAATKVEIPVVTTTQKAQKDHHDVIKAGHALSSTSGDDKHHTVKKDLKAHVQEPVNVEETKKESPATPPKLAPTQKQFVLEHSDAFLQEVRCLEVTSDAYFGKDVSPFVEHLKGLVFVGPILVVIAVYLVCTVLRTRLSTDHPSEFTQWLGCCFHNGMWAVVGLSMIFIAKYWTNNWHTVSSNTFSPDFPCAWTNLIILACFMSVAIFVEILFHKRLHHDLVLERSYRCYEVIDNSEVDPAGQNQAAHFSRTNVY
ncbi:hypothetical protein PENTCL1PPCAC_24718 [Pristionchus entomophagus]|uniref:Uncharacterized protein n=1 Tax=Pristionchus entomophagus TaxID=358040 RepID=A0AAV5U8V6_9BILA|nr:hypothetical protein PENTCL1PPCAC_24718 [Pristionchus entomophagus]